MFDSVHLFKNFYNNYLNKVSEYTPYGRIEANFEHGKIIKFADKLNVKCLKPVAIERCNVSLAAHIFHESTIHVLIGTQHNMPSFQRWQDS